jgi:hypothetical protein
MKDVGGGENTLFTNTDSSAAPLSGAACSMLRIAENLLGGAALDNLALVQNRHPVAERAYSQQIV